MKEQTYWCYDAHAQADFRAQMRRKYRGIERANKAWATRFTSWDDVRVLPPGAAPGAYWDDVLTWYRDTKRDFIRWHVALLQRLAPRKRVLVYIPGTAYSDAEWRDAVRTARGNDHVMMMADSRFLIDLAAKTRCWVQYTGAENAEEVANLRRYMDSRGYTDLPLWAENAGVLQAADKPLRLAEIVTTNRMYGLDYTHSHFLFGPDHVTPNAIAPELREAYARIAAFWAAR